MYCETCDKLLVRYKHAVKLYATAERSCPGLVGDDLRLTLENTTRLKQDCRDGDDTLTVPLCVKLMSAISGCPPWNRFRLWIENCTARRSDDRQCSTAKT
jgi:hypothetical protein